MHRKNNPNKEPKFIVVTGGVLSGLGKGIAAASIGYLISSRLKVTPIKCEGYLNIDPGTMNPLEHGEVFVLNDGEEADMDFGHYERFLDINCKSHWNVTMGKIYQNVFDKERKGEYLGKTVQLIPHVTDEIKNTWFKIAAEEDSDIVLIEIGGTVGDIETALHIEAARQLKKQVGQNNILYIHLTYIPVLKSVGEQKSKPTQQSVNLLREKGILPDIIIGRCSQMLEPKIKQKIATFCDVDPNAVITGLDVDSIYEIPLIFDQENVIDIIHKKLQIYSPPELSQWRKLVHNLKNPESEITIAICGKYTTLEDSYASINESLKHCSAHTKTKINLKFIETTKIENRELTPSQSLQNIAGVIIPGGFGTRGTEGKIQIIKYCRENNIPILGICYGLQLMVIEFARNMCGLIDANSSEINNTQHPVVDLMPEQKQVTSKGATMRLGAYENQLLENSLVHKLYNSTLISERHRHRYEVNPKYHDILKQKGLIISGYSMNNKLAEFIELNNHPYFIGTQAHPELKSKLIRPAPLFLGLVKAAINQLNS